MRSIHRTDSSNNPLGTLSSSLAVRYGASKEALQARLAARNEKLAELRELEIQLGDVRRRIDIVSVLPPDHPSRALEAGLIEQEQELLVLIAAVVVPPHPAQAEIDAALARMYGPKY